MSNSATTDAAKRAALRRAQKLYAAIQDPRLPADQEADARRELFELLREHNIPIDELAAMAQEAETRRPPPAPRAAQHGGAEPARRATSDRSADPALRAALEARADPRPQAEPVAETERAPARSVAAPSSAPEHEAVEEASAATSPTGPWRVVVDEAMRAETPPLSARPAPSKRSLKLLLGGGAAALGFVVLAVIFLAGDSGEKDVVDGPTSASASTAPKIAPAPALGGGSTTDQSVDDGDVAALRAAAGGVSVTIVDPGAPQGASTAAQPARQRDDALKTDRKTTRGAVAAASTPAVLPEPSSETSSPEKSASATALEQPATAGGAPSAANPTLRDKSVSLAPPPADRVRLVRAMRLETPDLGRELLPLERSAIEAPLGRAPILILHGGDGAGAAKRVRRKLLSDGAAEVSVARGAVGADPTHVRYFDDDDLPAARAVAAALNTEKPVKLRKLDGAKRTKAAPPATGRGVELWLAK